MVFDLDPGEGTSIVECCIVAGYITKELEKEGLESFAKTSGSKGLQLYSAAGPKSSWDGVRNHRRTISPESWRLTIASLWFPTCASLCDKGGS